MLQNLGNPWPSRAPSARERSPTSFRVASGITDMELGFSITCIETGPGWSCLGRRSSGQLGNGTTVQPVFPVPSVFGP